MLHKETIVQLTRDCAHDRSTVVTGTAGRVLWTSVLRRTCFVEFATSQGRTVVAEVDGRDLVEVQMNARA